MTIQLCLLMVGLADGAELGVGVYGGGWALPPSSGLPPNPSVGGRLRYRWSDSLGAELSLGTASLGIDPRLELLAFGSPGRVTPFAAVGGGALVLADEAMWLADLGGGVDAELFPWLDFRTDIRLRVLGEEKPSASVLFNAGLQVHTLRARDEDGDGVEVRSDRCRTEAEDLDGYLDGDGCPELDNDRDEIPDTADACPLDAEDGDGFSDADGCPDLDNDGDRVPDTADRCATDAEDPDGFEDADGCPELDNDADGFADAADRCALEPETVNGFQDTDGCPDSVPAEVARFSGTIAGVNFESGKARLLPSSSTVLDAAAKVLAEYPDVSLEVQGHTDDQGDDQKNLTLSQARAQAVVDYLVARGIDAKRLVAKGYGETTPKEPNTSAAGRASNRRVEFVRR